MLSVPSFPDQTRIHLEKLAGLFLPFLWLFSYATELSITAGFCPIYPDISKKIKHIQSPAKAGGRLQSQCWREGALGCKEKGIRTFSVHPGTGQEAQSQTQEVLSKHSRCSCLRSVVGQDTSRDSFQPQPFQDSVTLLIHCHRLRMSTDGQATTGKAGKSLCRLELPLVLEKQTTTPFLLNCKAKTLFFFIILTKRKGEKLNGLI